MQEFILTETEYPIGGVTLLLLLLLQPKVNGPAPMSRSDSNGSMGTFNTTSMPYGSSRGPSPLTIGMSDTVPLAVAFTETVNAYFKGHDASK